MLTSNQVLATHPLNLFEELDSALGSGADWLSWEPETVLEMLPEVDDTIAQDKVLAVQALAANSDLACSLAVAFEKVVQAFCNNPCVMDASQPPCVEELFYAVGQIRELVRKVHGKEAIFVGQVPGYVAAAGRYHGWFLLPEELSFATEMLDHLNGTQAETKRYQDYSALFDQGRAVVKALKEASLSLNELSSLEKMDPDSPASHLIRRVLRCLLYDPTLPYRK